MKPRVKRKTVATAFFLHNSSEQAAKEISTVAEEWTLPEVSHIPPPSIDHFLIIPKYLLIRGTARWSWHQRKGATEKKKLHEFQAEKIFCLLICCWIFGEWKFTHDGNDQVGESTKGDDSFRWMWWESYRNWHSLIGSSWKSFLRFLRCLLTFLRGIVLLCRWEHAKRFQEMMKFSSSFWCSISNCCRK